MVVGRILENWEPLHLFFSDRWLGEHLLSAEQINQSLNDPFINTLYLFLQWILPKVMTVMYRNVLIAYMKRDNVMKRSLEDVKPDVSQNVVSLNELYLRVGVMNQLQKKEVASNPEHSRQGIIAINKRKDTISTTTGFEELDDEWRMLPLHSLPDEVTSCSEVDEFWNKVRKHKNSGGECVFKVLPTFVLTAVSIPHFNADCKRVFSIVNLVRTNHINKLITLNLNGALLASECVQKSGSCCPSFKPTTDMVSRMSKANL
ncbi:hypothetical protein PR048_005848 [Dryococelus australis]|uniref:HAT C-terminal dimerisation domain-containing protein n=1 Tax=Dryococelus australis TaxID=614101 RepID=A0ABQ9I9W3_9NEOP|nr:hypothetical protein PR048_005848 [Dryococelus australis]